MKCTAQILGTDLEINGHFPEYEVIRGWRNVRGGNYSEILGFGGRVETKGNTYLRPIYKLVEVIILIKLIIIQLLLKLKFVNNGIQKINFESLEKITSIDST